MPHRQSLHSKLAKARQELRQAQIRVVELEAQLFEGQPNHIDVAVSENTYYHPLDDILEGCEIIGFDWRYLYINDAAVHYERCTKEELLGYTIMERYPGIEKTPVFSVLQRCMRERRTERIENKVIYPEGDSVWFELLVQPVPEGIFILSQDITERKQTELALLEREQQFRLFMEHAPAALAMLDNDMRYLLVSQRWLTDYRLSETNVIGRSHYELFPDLPERWKEIHQRCLAGAVESSEADPFPRADGSLDWVRWEIHPWRKLDSTIGGLLILSEVITERKHAEERIHKLHRTLGVLSDINQAIVRIRHLPALFEKVCEIAVEKGAFRMAWIGLFDPKTARINPVTHAGISESDLEKLINTLHAPPLSGALRIGEHLICNDIQNDPRWLAWREEALRLKYSATVALPLVIAGELRGIFNLSAGETDFFDAQEMRLMNEMAGDIALAIEVAEQETQRLNAEAAVKHYAQRMEILHKIDTDITNATSTKESVEAALQHIRLLIPCQRANVGLLDMSQGTGVIFAVDYDGDTALGQGLCVPIGPDFFDGYDVRHVKVVPDLRVLQATNPRFKQAVNEGLLSGINVILMVQDQPLGTLGLFANTPNFFTAEHQEILIEIGSRLTIAIHQQQLHEALLHYARTQAEERQLLETIFDAFPANCAVLNAAGTIIRVNAQWKQFAEENDAHSETHYLGTNYLAVCEQEVGLMADEAVLVAAGIRTVIAGEQEAFYFEYPCHSSTTERWFNLKVTPFAESTPRRVLVAHVDTTARKKAEDAERSQRVIAEALRNSLAALATLHNVEAVMQEIITQSATVIPSEAGTIILFEGNRGYVAYSKGFSPEAEAFFKHNQLSLDGGLFPTAYGEDDSYLVADTRAESRWISYPGTEWIRSSLGVPILLHGKPIGLLVADSATPNQFQKKDIDNFRMFARYAALALESAQLVDQLEQKVAERTAELREAEHRYHALFEQSHDAVFLVDMQGHILEVNHRAAQMLGYSSEELCALGYRELSDEVPKSEALIQQLLTGEVVPMYERVMRKKDGSRLSVEISVEIVRDLNGNPLHIQSVVRDITERKRSEETLRVSEGRYRLLAENIADIIMTFSLDRLITYMSPSCEKLLGYLAEEVEGQSHSEFIHPEDYPQVLDRTRRAVAEKENFYTNEFRLRHKAGHYIWYEVRTKLVFDDNTGNVVQFISILRDITERKRANDALRESEERFRHAIIDAPFPIMIHANDGEVLHISNVWTEISGYTHAEIPTMTAWIEKAYRENSQTARALIEKVYTLTKPRRGGEFRIRTKAGEERIWDFISAPLAAMPDGRRIVSSMAMDITERKHTEAMLQNKIEEEHQFQVHLKALHEIIIELTGIDQLDTFYKRAVEFGRERLGFERLAMFLYDEQDDSAIGTYGTDIQGKLVDEGGSRFTPDPNGVMQHSFDRIERFYLKEETTLYNDEVAVGVGWNAAAVLWNGTRSLGWFVADNLVSHKPAAKSLLDTLGLYALSVGPLLAQKQTQLALKESEALYRLLAENINDLIMRSTLTSECLYVSPSVQTLLGYTPEELIGQQMFGLIHPDDQAIIEEAYASALAQHDLILPHQYRAKHKTGHYIWLETVGKPIFREASTEVYEVITSSRDITKRRQSEEALRESEEKFRLLLDAAPVATIIIEQTGRISLVNVQAEHLFGYGRNELIGHMVELLVPDYARAGHENHRITYVAAPRVRPMGLGMALYAKRKDGSKVPVEIELSYIETQQGMMVISFIMDITERKRIAAELEQQRSFLRNVIDVSPSMIFVKDYDGRFVLVNPSVAAMYNTTIEALVGKTDADFSPIQQEVDDFLAADRQVITSGKMLFVEEPFTNSNGKVHWLQTTKVRIISADGQARYVLGVATDITERKEAEAALRASEEKYRSLVKTMRGGLAVFDPELRVTFVNDRFCELLGYSSEEVIGKQPMNFVDAADMPLVQAHLERHQSAESISYEIPLRHKDGHQIQALLSGSPLLDKQGKYIGSIVVATDISLQKQAEATLRQALAKEKELGDLKTRFVSMASHEFRTPLATILMLVETLSIYRSKLSEEQIQQRFDKIKTQIGRLTGIMEDVLMLVRMQARRVAFNPVKLDLDALFRSILEEFQSRADIKHRLEYNVSEVNHEVLFDRKLMEQIISNLVSNAIKYSPEEKVIRIHLEYSDPTVILKVSDEGIGIPEADLPYLFEPFHRAANVETIGGTGLGLVIIKEAVELHGGTITVESQVGVGTTFTVRIPEVLEREEDNAENSDH